jgi:signal recognition particle subunit SRP54
MKSFIVFESLSKSLGGILDGLRGKARLSESDVAAALAEIRTALLEADVALPVVKTLVEQIKAKAVGMDLIKTVQPGQQVVKIVHDELVAALGGENDQSLGEGRGPQAAGGPRDKPEGPDLINLNTAPPAVILMVGLQGSGKTTTSAKLAKYITDKNRKRVMMASLDTQRPAAQEQLRVLGAQIAVDTLSIVARETPIQITARALNDARRGSYDVLILDTAGRLAIDDALMNEVAAVKAASNPVETFLVADAMLGQDAVNTASAFDQKVGITGLILTRVDGDARGGAALSMRMVTGKTIRFLGVGEKTDALEPFHPDRLAGRILGMGDVVSLVERAVETVDADEAARVAAKFEKGNFDFNDLLAQFRQMKRMGGMNELAKMLPGLSKFSSQIEGANLDDKVLKRQEAIILSMTPAERTKPALLNASRRRRIANGSGTTVQDINKLVKQHEQMSQMMKRIKKMGMSGMMDMVKGFMGGKDAAMMDQLKDMKVDDLKGMANAGDLQKMMQNLPTGFPGGMGGGAHNPLSGLLGQLSGKLKK